MQQRLQQSNLLFLSNLSQETGPSLERVRTQLITDDLTSTTMKLEAHHFVDSPVIPAKPVNNAASGGQEDIESQNQGQQENDEAEEHSGWIHLPSRNTRAGGSDESSDEVGNSEQQQLARVVSDTCTICLCQYDEGESITWSTRQECVHAFHTQVRRQ